MRESVQYFIEKGEIKCILMKSAQWKKSMSCRHTGVMKLLLSAVEGHAFMTAEGKEYIDMTSGIGVNCLGYGNEALTEALSDQVQKLMHCSNLFYSEPMACVAKELQNPPVCPVCFLPIQGQKQTRQ